MNYDSRNNNGFTKPDYSTLVRKKQMFDSLTHNKQLKINGKKGSNILILSTLIVADMNDLETYLSVSEDKMSEDNLYLSTHSDALASYLHDEYGVHAIIEHLPFSECKEENHLNLSVERILTDPDISKFIKDNGITTIIRFFKQEMENDNTFYIEEIFGNDDNYVASSETTELLSEIDYDKFKYTYRPREISMSKDDMPKVITLALPVTSGPLCFENNLSIYRAVCRGIERIQKLRYNKIVEDNEKAREKTYVKSA